MLDKPGHIITDLRKAIEDRAIEVHYQPQVSADGNTIVGVEALARLRKPDGTLAQPDEFIPNAQSDLDAISLLGEFVLEQACRDARSWEQITVGVNVAPAQCNRPGFAAHVLDVIARSGITPQRLELEILESSWFDDATTAVDVLRRLRTAGVSIAMDDFGTGYASLGALLELPLNKLKIDRSFISKCHEIRSASIVHAIVALARAIGLKITAEGVENKTQARFLRVAGCHYLQGFFFSPPVPASQITAMMSAKSAMPLSA